MTGALVGVLVASSSFILNKVSIMGSTYITLHVSHNAYEGHLLLLHSLSH